MEFEDMSLDNVDHVLRRMQPADLLNLMLTSVGMARNFAKHLPAVRELKIRVLDGETKGICCAKSADLQVSQKNRAATEQALGLVLPHLVEAAESLHVENELINEEISDRLFARILQLIKNAPLRELALSEIDLEHIHSWTLALLANFSRLEKIEIEDCKLGEGAEAKLLRCLQGSFQTLTQIDLKGTPEITDHFSRRVSRACPNLAYFRISDCPRVTTLSALPLIEAAVFRLTDKLDVHMGNTEFDADQLRSFMHSPFFGSCSADWSLEPIVVPLGYDKPALMALHSSRKIVLIFV